MRYYTGMLPGMLFGAVLLIFGPYARAVDGVIEINHAKAVAGGITPGDGPGYPVTIDQPGSYRLTSNLGRFGSGNVIEVTADHVTLDLNGFRVACFESFNVFCTTGSGIAASGTEHVTVRNGSVTGFGSSGNMASDNNRHGIHAGSASTVTGNTVSDNVRCGLGEG